MCVLGGALGTVEVFWKSGYNLVAQDSSGAKVAQCHLKCKLLREGDCVSVVCKKSIGYAVDQGIEMTSPVRIARKVDPHWQWCCFLGMDPVYMYLGSHHFQGYQVQRHSQCQVPADHPFTVINCKCIWRFHLQDTKLCGPLQWYLLRSALDSPSCVVPDHQRVCLHGDRKLIQSN